MKRLGHAAPDADWFQSIADSVFGVVFFILRTRPDVAFEFVNAGSDTELVGYVPDNTPEDSAVLLSYVHPESESDLARVLALGPGESIDVEVKWRHMRGYTTHSRIRARARRRPDGSVIVEGAMQDVTELHAAQEAVTRSEERHRLLAEHAAAIVWSMDPDGTVTYVSAAVEQLRGFSTGEAENQRTDDVFLPDSAAEIRRYLGEMNAALVRGEIPKALDLEVQCYRRDGTAMVGLMSVIPHLDSAGRLVEMVGIIQDISDRRAMEAELRQMATTDPLTGVWNRRYTDTVLRSQIQVRSGPAHSMLMLDVDHFKRTNDTLGHVAGDQLLANAAEAISRRVRSGDIVARWGGDEFLVVLWECPLQQALQVAENISNALRADHISVTIGVSELSTGEDWQGCLRRADEALYRAKNAGRGGISL